MKRQVKIVFCPREKYTAITFDSDFNGLRIKQSNGSPDDYELVHLTTHQCRILRDMLCKLDLGKAE